jgi:RNA polymerase sigma-54 factor
MALMQRMDLRQGQSLVMTPQLQQAIKLLQMSNLELQAYVEGELERNPLLERDERGSDVPKTEARNPRNPEVIEGVSLAIIEVSEIRITSALSRSLFAFTNSPR